MAIMLPMIMIMQKNESVSSSSSSSSSSSNGCLDMTSMEKGEEIEFEIGRRNRVCNISIN